MARMIVAEEEARRMQNIRDGIGCPHGRTENGCYPCSLEEVGALTLTIDGDGAVTEISGGPLEEPVSVKAATKRFSKEYANVKRERSK